MSCKGTDAPLNSGFPEHGDTSFEGMGTFEQPSRVNVMAVEAESNHSRNRPTVAGFGQFT